MRLFFDSDRFSVDFDPDVDALYVYINRNVPHNVTVASTETVCESPFINIDRDSSGNVVGIEVL